MKQKRQGKSRLSKEAQVGAVGIVSVSCLTRSVQHDQGVAWITEGKGMKRAGAGHVNMNKLSDQMMDEGFAWLRDLIREGEAPYIPTILYLAEEYRKDSNFAGAATLLSMGAETGDEQCCQQAIYLYTNGGPTFKPNPRKAAEIARWQGRGNPKKQFKKAVKW